MKIARFALRLLTTFALVVMAVCSVQFPPARESNPAVGVEAPQPSPAESGPHTSKPFQQIYGIDPARMLLYNQKELRMREDEQRMREMIERMRKTLEGRPDTPKLRP
jgi:hypothetical protein